MQSVNRHIFSEVLLQHFVSASEDCQGLNTWASLSAEEETAIRYAGGYVALKLQKKFMKQNGIKARHFVECLCHMAVEGDESSFLKYTQAWIDKVNRGGLFEINDATFLLFKGVEVQTQNLLPHHLQKRTSTKNELIALILEEENVQIMWSLLSLDIGDDNESQQLLQEIVEMWVTMRGFAMTSFWMEEYKRINREATKKRKALRKVLKQKCDKENP